MTNDFLSSVKNSKVAKCEEEKKEEKEEEGREPAVKVEKKVIPGPSKKLATDMEKKLKAMDGDVTVVRDTWITLP